MKIVAQLVSKIQEIHAKMKMNVFGILVSTAENVKTYYLHKGITVFAHMGIQAYTVN